MTLNELIKVAYKMRLSGGLNPKHIYFTNKQKKSSRTEVTMSNTKEIIELIKKYK